MNTCTTPVLVGQDQVASYLQMEPSIMFYIDRKPPLLHNWKRHLAQSDVTEIHLHIV